MLFYFFMCLLLTQRSRVKTCGWIKWLWNAAICSLLCIQAETASAFCLVGRGEACPTVEEDQRLWRLKGSLGFCMQPSFLLPRSCYAFSIAPMWWSEFTRWKEASILVPAYPADTPEPPDFLWRAYHLSGNAGWAELGAQVIEEKGWNYKLKALGFLLIAKFALPICKKVNASQKQGSQIPCMFIRCLCCGCTWF